MSVIDNFIGANKTSKGLPGLVPAAPAAGATGLFLRSDGQWAEVISAGTSTVLQTIIATGETHLEAINRVVGNSNKISNVGDIVILKDLISADNYQNIAYVYDGQKWIAMDGNYNIENVYLKDDLTITSDIGVQKLNGAGSRILPTTGKNLKQVLDMLLVERALPNTEQPYIDAKVVGEGEYEVGTLIAPSYEIAFNSGKYTYGPETGVVADKWKVEFNNEILDSDKGTFSEFYIPDNFNEKIKISATHIKGYIPNDNLGNVITDKNELNQCQIQAGETVAYSNIINSFRYGYYGAFKSPIELTNNNIKNMSSFKSTDDLIKDMVIPEGTKQIVIAVPTGRTISKVNDNNAFGMNIFPCFTKKIVAVSGANPGFEKDYNVFIYSPSVALGENTYSITFKEENA